MHLPVEDQKVEIEAITFCTALVLPHREEAYMEQISLPSDIDALFKLFNQKTVNGMILYNIQLMEIEVKTI